MRAQAFHHSTLCIAWDIFLTTEHLTFDLKAEEALSILLLLWQMPQLRAHYVCVLTWLLC